MNNCLGGAIGAYVIVVALAPSQQEFVSLLVDRLNAEGFDVSEIEDVDTWQRRKANCDVAEEIQELINAINFDNRVAFGPFDAYDSEP